jgi:hypothetical protein
MPISYADDTIDVRIFRQQLVPNNPTKKDVWWEVDSSDIPKFGWAWFYDGAVWRSPDQFWEFSLGGAGPSGITANFDTYFNCDQAFNSYYFKTLTMKSFHTIAQVSGTLWTVRLRSRTVTNAATNIAVANTSGKAANQWGSTGIIINATVASIPNLLFSVDFEKSSNDPGPLFAAVQVKYQFVR